MVLVVFPGGKDTKQALNTSIGRVARTQAEVLSGVTPVTVTTTDNMGRSEVGSFGRVILSNFRPTDVLSREWMKDMIREDARVCVSMLIHEQDKACGFLRKAYEMVNRNRWTFTRMVDSASDYGIYFPVPVRRRIEKTVEGRRILASEIDLIQMPVVTVATAPSVRKNSIFGVLAALEAANQYQERCKINIHVRGGSIEAVGRLIKSVPLSGNTEISVHGVVSDAEMDSLYRLSTTIFYPSIDEGLNLLPIEYGWIGSDNIMADLPCNREKKGIKKTLFELHSSIVGGGRVGEDEITGIVSMGFPSFGDVVSKILDSMRRWERTKRNMRKRAVSTIVAGENYRQFLDAAISILGIQRPYMKGEVRYI